MSKRRLAPSSAWPTLNGGDVDLAREPELFADALFDFLERLGVLARTRLRVFPSLAEPLAAIGEPRTAFLDDALFNGEVEQIALARDAFAVHHVEFGLAERRRHFVLHDLDARAAAHHGVAVLDAGDAANVHADRRVELQRTPSRGGLRVAEHHADLLAQLVDEDQAGLRFRHNAR